VPGGAVEITACRTGVEPGRSMSGDGVAFGPGGSRL
jgi:hypothetical protein